MKKTISILLAACLLISLTACGKASQQNAGRSRTEYSTDELENPRYPQEPPATSVDDGYWHDEDPTTEPTTDRTSDENDTSLPEGASSLEELVSTIIGFINTDGDYSEIENLFDWYGIVTYRMIDDNNLSSDFVMVRAVVDNLDKGEEYIQQNYPEFWSDWEQRSGERDGIGDFVELRHTIDELSEEDCYEMIMEYAQYAPLDNTFYEDNNYEHSDSEGVYVIPIDSDFYYCINIRYYINNGRYYAYMMHYTA